MSSSMNESTCGTETPFKMLDDVDPCWTTSNSCVDCSVLPVLIYSSHWSSGCIDTTYKFRRPQVVYADFGGPRNGIYNL